ncbi:DUF2690 domain-containing protein [Streptomyces sp. NPDC003691]
MPQWKALPEGLDPDIRELTEQLRRIVDGSGLDIAGLSVATGFGVTSWERYLDARILPPQRAIAALAERTGTGIHGLTALRSRAETAWYRLEAGRDRATEQLRVARTREWASVPKPKPAPEPAAPGAATGSEPSGRDPLCSGAPAADPFGPELLGPGSSGPEAVGPATADADMSSPPAAGGSAADALSGAGGPDSGPSAWNAVLVDDGGPATPPRGAYVPEGGGRAAARRARRAAEAAEAAAAGGPPPTPAPSATAATTPTAAGAPTRAPGPAPRASGVDKRRILLFLAGVAGALVLILGAVFAADLGVTGGGTGGDRDRTEPVAKVPPTPSGSASPGVPLPPEGVECTGAACTGKNPEEMGCGGDFARTVSQATVGKARIEVRFSQVCQAAWARLVDASTGDSVHISVGGKGKQTGTVNGKSDAYTPMTAAVKGSDAKACAELTNGTTACTVVQ